MGTAGRRFKSCSPSFHLGDSSVWLERRSKLLRHLVIRSIRCGGGEATRLVATQVYAGSIPARTFGGTDPPPFVGTGRSPGVSQHSDETGGHLLYEDSRKGGFDTRTRPMRSGV